MQILVPKYSTIARDITIPYEQLIDSLVSTPTAQIQADLRYSAALVYELALVHKYNAMTETAFISIAKITIHIPLLI